VTCESTLGFTPLSGFKVLDLSQGVAGPYCTQLLSHQGAEVIKIEPAQGDWGRHVGVSSNGHSTLSCTYNAGKQSFAVDAKHPEGKALILALAKTADIVVQNFRPQTVQRLGLDFESLTQLGLNPVYVSISGYGADGPFSENPATDSVMQADSGLMSTNRDVNGSPQRVGFLLADIATGIYAAQACTASLLQRAKTGKGVHVELNLFNVCCALQSTAFSEEVIAKQVIKQAVSAPNGIFDAVDGKITILALNNDQFQRISQALSLTHWEQDPRFATNELRLQHKAILHTELADVVRNWKVAELETRFNQHSVLHARVRNASEVLQHPQAQHLSTFQTLHQPGFGDVLIAATPWPVHTEKTPKPAPRIGEHSAKILNEIGLDSTAINKLATEHVIKL
jgi:crotonobetainyl-CoA:carnitine CoA-transferase CaiB-like acyl-CoA transferase